MKKTWIFIYFLIFNYNLTAERVTPGSSANTCQNVAVCSSIYGIVTGDEVVVIENVHLVDAVLDRILRNRTVIIIDGIISKIEAARQHVKLQQAKYIEGSGKYLMPGLSDMHVHLGDAPEDLIFYLNYGVTTIRSLDGTPQHVQWKKEVDLDEREGPTIITSGPIQYGQDGDFDVFKWSEYPNPSLAANAIVNKHIELGYDALKVYYQLSAEQYDALSMAAKKLDLPMVGHVPWSKSILEILRAGQRSNEHMTGFDVEMLVERSESAGIRTAWGNMIRLNEIDDEKMKSFLDTVAAFKEHWIVPTAIPYHVFVMPEFVDTLLGNKKMMTRLSSKKRTQWVSFNRWQIPHPDSLDSNDQKIMHNATDKMKQWIKSFHDAGINLAVGTDSGARWVYPGLATHQELEIYVQAGLTPAQALRCTTVQPAALLQQQHIAGQIREGFKADCVMIENNPLQNIRATRDIIGVMKKGRWYPREELDEKMEVLYQQRNAN